MTDRPLPPNQRHTAQGKWPVVGERAPAFEAPTGDPDRWQLEIIGRVARPQRWTLSELFRRPDVTTTTIDLHCVTRWSRQDTPLTGIWLRDLLAEAEPLPDARFLSLVAYSTRKHSSSLPLHDEATEGTFIAWASAGEPLSVDRGGPLRNITPGKYLYKSVKWLTTIELLTEDRLGFWEAQAGYHNDADPWREQRYILPSVSRLEARAILAKRNIRGRSFVGLPAAGLALAGLDATESLLRNADFTWTDLSSANFSAANLSNASLRGTNLRDAILVGADLEGADFSGADLRGADLTGASLFGATLFDEVAAAAQLGTAPLSSDEAAVWVQRLRDLLSDESTMANSAPMMSTNSIPVATLDETSTMPANYRETLSPVQSAFITMLVNHSSG